MVLVVEPVADVIAVSTPFGWKSNDITGNDDGGLVIGLGLGLGLGFFDSIAVAGQQF